VFEWGLKFCGKVNIVKLIKSNSSSLKNGQKLGYPTL
jgi:hypothetical protein